MTPPAGRDANEKPYLSIREVLDLLVEEFPDVTVSKIRFLESRGLIHPERTPSGYRKFYDHDVDRLRWILRQQRENFLPLKIIKGRLEQEAGQAALEGAQSLFESDELDESESLVRAGVVSSLSMDTAGQRGADVRGERNATTSANRGRGARTENESEEPPSSAPASAPGPRERSGLSGQGGPSEGGGPRQSEHNQSPATPRGERHPLGVGVHFSTEELAVAAGCELALVTELEEYGLICGREIGGVRCFDEKALLVTRVAASFRRFGIEARHLKSFKYAAEREAGLFAQVVSPLLRQRNPEARERARAELAELADLAQQLQQLFVSAELAELTGG